MPAEGPGRFDPAHGGPGKAPGSDAPDREPTAPRDHLTDLGLVSLAAIWGVNFVVVKLGLEALPPLAFNTLRFPLACVVLYGVLRSRPGPLLPRSDGLVPLVGLGLLGHVVYQCLFIFGIDRTLAGNASILLATVPVWTTLLSLALGHERPSMQVWLGVAGTLTGMALVVLGGGGVSLGGATFRGDVLMTGAAVAWALYTVASRRLVLEYGALRVTAWTLWIGTPGIVVLGLPDLLRTNLEGVPVGAWAAVVYAGVLALAVAYVAWYRGVEKLGSSRTAVYSNLVPVVALLTGWLWLGEVPSSLQIAGAALVVASLTLARLGGPRPERGRRSAGD